MTAAFVAEYMFFDGMGAKPAMLATFKMYEGAFFSNNGSNKRLIAIQDSTLRLTM